MWYGGKLCTAASWHIMNRQSAIKKLNWSTMDFTSYNTEVFMSTAFTFHDVEDAGLTVFLLQICRKRVWSEKKKHRMRFKQDGHRDIQANCNQLSATYWCLKQKCPKPHMWSCLQICFPLFYIHSNSSNSWFISKFRPNKIFSHPISTEASSLFSLWLLV